MVAHEFGGLRLDRATHQLLNAEREVNEGMYAIGEMTKAYYLITADMPTVAEQADLVARHVAERLTDGGDM